MGSLSDLWLEALVAFYSLAKGERAAELRDEYIRRYDSRGLHPLSLEAGRVFALQAAEPVLSNAGFDPVGVRVAAREDAYEEHLGRSRAVRLLVEAAAERQMSDLDYGVEA